MVLGQRTPNIIIAGVGATIDGQVAITAVGTGGQDVTIAGDTGERAGTSADATTSAVKPVRRKAPSERTNLVSGGRRVRGTCLCRVRRDHPCRFVHRQRPDTSWFSAS